MGGIYGVVRGPLNQLISPLTSRVPLLGNLSDEVVLLGANWLLARNTKGNIRELATTGLTIEAFAVGAGLGQRLLGGMLGSGGTVAVSANQSFR